jgi:hypothetical protein
MNIGGVQMVLPDLSDNDETMVLPSSSTEMPLPGAPAGAETRERYRVWEAVDDGYLP